jgi:hypothetical protein
MIILIDSSAYCTLSNFKQFNPNIWVHGGNK